MKKSATKLKIKEDTSSVINWGICFILIFAILAKGLYNEEMLLGFGIFTSTLFLYSLIRYKWHFGAGDALVLLLAVSSLVSFLTNAANPRGALLHILNVLLYYMVYNLITKIQNDQSIAARILYSVITSVLLLIMSALVEYSFYGGAFQSLLGYSNSFAAIVVVAIVLHIFLFSKESLQSTKIVYFLKYTLSLSIMALVITKSRGSLLTLILLLLFIGVAYRNRVKMIFDNLFLDLVISFIVGTLITPLAGSIFFVAMLILPLPIIIASNLIITLINRYKLIKYSLIAVITLLGSYAFYRGQFYARLISLGTADKSSIARYLFYVDGLKIFKDNPFFGTGAGGWLALYKQYQGHAYNTLEAHSFLIQYLAELGLVGTLVFSAFVIYKWILYLKTKMRQETLWYQDCAFIVTLGMLGHALIDIDLSLPGLSVILYSMFALLPDMNIGGKTKARHVMQLAIPTIVLICFLLMGTGRLLTNSFFKESADGLTLEEMKKYERRYAIGTLVDPLNSEYYNYLAQMNLNLGKKESDQNKINEGLTNFNKSIKYLPNFVDAYVIRAQIMDGLGKEEEALESYKEACNKAPLSNTQKDLLISYYVKLGIRNKESHYFSEAIEYINSTRKLMENIEEQRKKIWTGDYLGYSCNQCYYAGLASFYLGDYAEGLDYFKNAISSSGYRILSPEMKKQIQGLVVMGEMRNGIKPSYKIETEYLAELENKVKNYGLM